MRRFVKITTIFIFAIFGLFLILSMFSGLVGNNTTLPGSQPAPIAIP